MEVLLSWRLLHAFTATTTAAGHRHVRKLRQITALMPSHDIDALRDVQSAGEMRIYTRYRRRNVKHTFALVKTRLTLAD